MRSTDKPSPRTERTRHVEALLDDALRMTFPASDPIAPAVDTKPSERQGVTAYDHVHPSRPDPVRSTKRERL
jgi:hypothetical protein